MSGQHRSQRPGPRSSGGFFGRGSAPLVLLLLAACAGPPKAPDLRRDEAWFPAAPEPAAVAEVLAVDEAMRAFVEQSTRGATSRREVLEGLFHGLFDPGGFVIRYRIDETLTASETFHRREGNCLSVTALMVALAREAGLQARFQDFLRQPQLRRDASYWIHDRHVNARIELDRGEWVTLDFDRRAEAFGPVRVIDDAAAVAQFFSNRGVDALRRGDHARAYANFLQALEATPRLAYVWNNIGVLYRRAGRPERAEAIFRHALALDGSELRALSNLAGLHRASGRLAAARELEDRLEHARRRDPFHLYLLARRAYEDGEYERAREFLDKAMKLRSGESAFEDLLVSIERREHRAAAR